MRRNSAARSRLLNGRRSLRSRAFNDDACSRAASRRSSRLDSFDFAPRLESPRLEFRADGRSSRLEARRSLADSFLPRPFLPLSTRGTLRRGASAWRFLARTEDWQGRTRRTKNMSAILKVRGCRFINVIEGSSPFLGILLFAHLGARRKFAPPVAKPKPSQKS